MERIIHVFYAHIQQMMAADSTSVDMQRPVKLCFSKKGTHRGRTLAA